MNKRKLLLVALSLCMVAILAMGGTLAYLTDTDNQTNVFTVGNVQIEQKETDNNGQPFEQNQTIMPIIDASDKYNDPNYVWKNVTVKNTGKSAAYVRTFIAIPMVNYNNDNNAANNWLHWNGYSATDASPVNAWYWGTEENGLDWPGNNEGWNCFEQTIDGEKYMVYVATHTTALAGDANGNGDETAPCLRGFFLDSSVDNEVVDGKLNYFYMVDGKKVDLGDISNLKIYVATQACQQEGFANAWDALDTSFGPASDFDFNTVQ